VPDDAARARVAREALARAKADALAKGNRPARPPVHRPERDAAADSPAPRRPGRRSRRDDPEPLNDAIGALLDAHGWREAAAVGSVFGRWAEIVGPELAAHTRPDSLADGELTVTADSTAWATQVRLLAAHLVRRLNAELGDGAVQRVRVRGPAGAAGPARRPGEWRVRGGRGPRDTYG
jgi:predicted nucleic acid-binding Zn ribbon protein